MRSTLRIAALIGAGVVALSGCAPDQPPEAKGSGGGCYGPWLDSKPVGGPPASVPPLPSVTARPGETITVYGRGYTATCNDTGQDSPLEPLPQVELTLTTANSNREKVGKHTPTRVEGDVVFSARITIPLSTSAGIAVISDNRTPAATLEIAVTTR